MPGVEDTSVVRARPLTYRYGETALTLGRGESLHELVKTQREKQVAEAALQRAQEATEAAQQAVEAAARRYAAEPAQPDAEPARAAEA